MRHATDRTGHGRAHHPRRTTRLIQAGWGTGGEKGERDWGYTTASDPSDLLKRIEALVKAVIKSGKCTGFVYTQLTDIEQEVNGLYTWDRRPKLKAEDVKRVIERAKWWFYELEMRI